MSTVSSNATSVALPTGSVASATAQPSSSSSSGTASFSEILNSLPQTSAPVVSNVATTPAGKLPTTPTTAMPTSIQSSTGETVGPVSADDVSPLPAAPNTPDTSAAQDPTPSQPNLSVSDACAANAKVLRALALTNNQMPALVDPLAPPVANDQNVLATSSSTTSQKDVSETDTKDSDAASSTDASSDDTKATAAVTIPIFTPPIPLPLPIPTNFMPVVTGNSDGDMSGGSTTPSAVAGVDQPIANANANVVRDLYAQSNSAPSSGTATHDGSADQAASAQLNPLRKLLDAMTPVNTPAPQPSAPASPDNTALRQDVAAPQDSAGTFTIRTTTTGSNGTAQRPTVQATSSDAADARANISASTNATVIAAQSTDANQKVLAPVQNTPPAAVVADVASSAAQYTAANSPKNAAQLSGISHDQNTVAAPAAPVASAATTLPNSGNGASANNSDSTAGQERQSFQATQLAASTPKASKAETFAANAFSAVAPGAYWTEKTPEAAATNAPDVLTHVVDALPKPLQATTITIKPEGYGAITIRVMPTPQDSNAPWRISIRTTDPSAHALLSQNVAELRQNLKGDPSNVLGSLKPALQTGATPETPMRQDSQNSKGGQGTRQDFEQRQRNRSRGYVFELPELDA